MIGQEADYNFEATDRGNRIKVVSTYQGGGSNVQSNGQAEPGKQASIEKQVALKIAAETVDINKHGIDALFTVADKYFAWLQGKNSDSVPVTPQQPETLVDTTGQTADKLPF